MKVEKIPAIIINGDINHVIVQNNAVEGTLTNGQKIEGIFVGYDKDGITIEDFETKEWIAYALTDIKHIELS